MTTPKVRLHSLETIVQRLGAVSKKTSEELNSSEGLAIGSASGLAIGSASGLAIGSASGLAIG